MENAQKCFNLAQENYNKAISYIRDMGTQLQRHAEKYSVDLALRQFDHLLQSILLRIAISDNRLDRVEVEVIMKLTDYGDLVKWIDANSETTFTWNNVYNMPEADVSKLLDLMDKILAKQSVDLYYPLALVDSVTSFNYFAAIQDCMVKICVALCYVDGDFQEEAEVATAAIAVKQYFEVPYLASLEQHKANQSTAAQAQNTLESNFEKMKKKQ